MERRDHIVLVRWHDPDSARQLENIARQEAARLTAGVQKPTRRPTKAQRAVLLRLLQHGELALAGHDLRAARSLQARGWIVPIGAALFSGERFELTEAGRAIAKHLRRTGRIDGRRR